MLITTFNLQLRKCPHTSKAHKISSKKIEKAKRVPQESLLVTLNVKSLYTNIANNEGIKAVEESYEKYKEKAASTKVIIAFLSLILALNNFVFNCTHYLQTMGCTMDTIYVQYIKKMSLLYLRYIDDIFMIWKGTKPELMTFTTTGDEVVTFIKNLNEKHETIKFDVQVLSRKIAFLDAMLYKDENN